MKTPVFPHMVALLFLSATPLFAQNPASSPTSAEISVKAESLDGNSGQGFANDVTAPGEYNVPDVEKAQGKPRSAKPAYADQDPATLDSKISDQQKVESVVDLDVLRNASPYRKVMVSTASQPDEIAAKTLQNGLAQISAVYRESGKSEAHVDCPSVALAVGQRIKLDSSKVLEVVESEVGANPTCACEIVKTSIKESDADIPQVVSIVETAINVTPENMRIISQCAIAAMPESVAAVQSLLAKLDPNSGNAGTKSAKSSKDAKSAKEEIASATTPPETPNPLDLPPHYPPIPPIVPPVVTEVNPHVNHH